MYTKFTHFFLAPPLAARLQGLAAAVAARFNILNVFGYFGYFWINWIFGAFLFSLTFLPGLTLSLFRCNPLPPDLGPEM